MAAYTLRIADLANSTLVADVPVSDLSYSDVLNAPGAANFTLAMRDAACTATNMDPGARIIEISRDGDLVWGGYLWATQLNTEDELVQASCEGWFSRLRRRGISDSQFYKDDEVQDIAWALIDYTQDKPSGDLGITRDPGETPSGTVRSRQFCCWQFNNIADEIVDLADSDDGFDFEITPARVWKVYHPRKSVLTSVVFEFGADDDDATDISAMSVDRDAADMATQMLGLPDADGCVDCDDTVMVESSPGIATYGLLQLGRNMSDKRSVEDKRAQLREGLRIHRRPRSLVSLMTTQVPFDAGYSIGDRVTLHAMAGYLNFDNQVMRNVAHTVTVRGGQELVQVNLDSVVTDS